MRLKSTAPLGPGLIESVYMQCLACEMHLHGLSFKLHWPVPVEYKGVRLACGFRVDVLVEDRLIIELKAVHETLNVHQAQLLTYMKLSGVRTGLLINFNKRLLKHGVRRFIL